jgi:hypothetical protein
MPEILIAPSSTEGEAEFSLQVGRTIARWQMVETFLGILFLEIVDCNTTGPASIAFSGISTVQNKLQVIGQILKFRLEFKRKTSILSAWQRIQRDAGKAAQKRNKIVHGSSVHISDGPVLIVPNLYDIRTIRSVVDGNFTFSDKITFEDLSEIEKEFTAIWDRIVSFHQKILDVLALPK